MLFNINKGLSSPHSQEEIENKLRHITKLPGSKSQAQHLFEGKIDSDHFLIYPIFDLAPRNQFRPEIYGALATINGATQINLQFRISSAIKLLFIVAAIFNLIVAVVLLLLSLLFGWAIFAALVGFFISLVIHFRLKVKSSNKVLAAALQATEIPFTT